MNLPTPEMLSVSRLFLAVLLHFVWQATLIVALIAIGRSLIHPKFFQVRYVLSVVGLAAVLISPLVTLGYYAFNTDAMLALCPPSSEMAAAGTVSNQTPGLMGQFEAQFQTVFGWFDNHRLLWLSGWFAGFAVLVLRLSLSLGHCFRLRRSQKPLPPHLQKMADRLKSKLNLTRAVIVGTSQEITQAVATGIIKPVVLVPAAWITQLPVSSIEAVLAHELGHVKRWDLWINFFQRFTETVFFFHPLVWWLSQKITSEREVCCDQLAVRVTGQPMRYVETLAQVAGTKTLNDFEFQFGTAFTGGKDMNLLRRAKMILEPASIHAPSPLRTLVLIASVCLLVSYGSYAYCSAANPAASTLQDKDHNHDHPHRADHDHDHAIHQNEVIEVRQIKRGSPQGNDIDVLIVDSDSAEHSDHENDLHLHLAELLHRNKKGSVSDRELATKLRQLADHLESSHNKVRAANNFRHKIEVQQKRDSRYPIRRKADVVVDRLVDEPQELVVDWIPKQEPKTHSRDDIRDRIVVQSESQRPRKMVRDEPIVQLTERRFGHATTPDDELGQVLRELKIEVQQLRREVNQLQSEKNPKGFRDELKRQDDQKRHFDFKFRDYGDLDETHAEDQSEFRRRYRDSTSDSAENAWAHRYRTQANENQNNNFAWIEEERGRDRAEYSDSYRVEKESDRDDDEYSDLYRVEKETDHEGDDYSDLESGKEPHKDVKDHPLDGKDRKKKRKKENR